MSEIKKKINLFNYRHDRSTDYKSSTDKLYAFINNLTNQEELTNIYKYFENKYKLPQVVVKQEIRQYLAKSFILKQGSFNGKLKLRYILLTLIKYGALFYAFFFVKIKSNLQNYKIIIDYVTSTNEIKLFEKLLLLYGYNQVLIITRNTNINKNFADCNFYNKKPFRGIILKDLLNSIYNELLFGLWIVLKASMLMKFNFFPISLKIIHDYLSFKSIFKSNKSQFIIQLKHYNSEPIKNYLFKKFDGIFTTSLQKNIIQSDPIFFYSDFDILFSLGEHGFNRLFEYGGRIDRVIPVGSLIMERNWFDLKKNQNKKFDIAILGINTSNAYNRLDSYDKFMDDYYALYRWTAKLSIEYPKYKIVLIHHSSAGIDEIENKILRGSNIEVLDKNKNSYEIAFSSKFALTYGSTMGYELNAHNLLTFFIDPGNRCSFLPEKGYDEIDNFRVESYESLSLIAKKIITDGDSQFKNTKLNFNKLCLKSSDVSSKIYKQLN